MFWSMALSALPPVCRPRARVLLLTLALLWSGTGGAQTLGTALEQAWVRLPIAAELTARDDEAQARSAMARAWTPGPPSVSLSSLNDRLNANTGKQEWEAELAVPLWLPGQRAARSLEAEAAAAELAARRAALRLQLAGELRSAWWQLAAARQAVAVALRREASAQALLVDVQRRFKAGDLARLDANLAHNERLTAQGERLEAAAAQRQAEQTYQALTGAAPPEDLAQETMQPVSDLSTGHARLVAARAVAALAQARLALAQQTRREAPELALRLSRERGDLHASYANAVGVKLTLPLSSGPRVRQDSAAAQAESLQASAELVLTEQRLALAADRARLDVDLARQQQALAQQRHELSADNLRLAEKSFALGESDLAMLLRARASAFEAEALLGRQSTALAASVSRLNQSLGVLP